MKKRKIITIALTAVLTLALAGGIAYGAYKFTKNTTGITDVGQINISSTGFIDLRVTSDGDDAQRAKASKIRKDTVVFADEVEFSKTNTYKAATGTVDSSITYYSNQTGAVATPQPVDGTSAVGYYVVDSTQIDGISGFKMLYDQSLNTIEPTIKKITNNTGTIKLGDILLDYELDLENARIRTLTNHDSEDIVNRVALHSDKLGFVITDSTYVEANKEALMANVIADDMVTCSATETKYTTAAQAADKMYLNQLAFAFTFTPEVDCYVRVHFEDAWLRHRKYASTVRESYIVKGEIEGDSPFAVSGDWIYNKAENTAYFKTIFKPSIDETSDTKAYEAQTYIFTVNPAYFYTGGRTSAYVDYIDVEVAFTVDAIQANRAKQVWGKDPFNNFTDVE